MDTATQAPAVLVVVVKGSRFVAARAAADRGIPFVFRQELRKGAETVGHVPVSFRDTVARWFTEDNGPSPFPVGTVLIYSTRTLD